MTEPSVRMNKPDFVEKANRADEVFLKKLRLPEAPDCDFPYYWLSSAALILCLNLKDVEFRSKLKYVDDLVEALKNGFEEIKDVSDNLPEEESGSDRNAKHVLHRLSKNLDQSKMVQGKTHKFCLRGSIERKSQPYI